MTAKGAKGAAFGVWVVWRSSTRKGQGRQVAHTPTRAPLAPLASLPCTIPYMAPRLDPEGDLSRKLREALRTTDESIRSISTATGVTRQTLMAFRDGKRTIYLDAADRIAAHFRMTLRKDSR